MTIWTLMIQRYWWSPSVRMIKGNFRWESWLWQSKSLRWYLSLWWSCSDQRCSRDRGMLGLDAINHMELSDWQKGGSVQITKTILRVEVDKQRKLNPGTLKLWDKVWHKCGISVQETSPESGYDQSHSCSSSGRGSSKDADEAQPTRPKRKLRQSTYCVRSFTEEEKLGQNINVEDYMDKSFDPHLCLCWRWPWPSVIQ